LGHSANSSATWSRSARAQAPPPLQCRNASVAAHRHHGREAEARAA
jgi:hypothetical protein